MLLQYKKLLSDIKGVQDLERLKADGESEKLLAADGVGEMASFSPHLNGGDKVTHLEAAKSLRHEKKDDEKVIVVEQSQSLPEEAAKS